VADLAQGLKQNGREEDVAIFITMLPQIVQALCGRLVWIGESDRPKQLRYPFPQGFAEVLPLIYLLDGISVDRL